MHFSPFLITFLASAVSVKSLATARRDSSDDSEGSSPSYSQECMDPSNTIRGEHVTSCQPANWMDATGQCGNITAGNNCVSYCQVSLYWDYGEEVPFHGTWCSKTDDKCSITTKDEVSFTNEFSFSIGGSLDAKRKRGEGEPGLDALKAGFNAGATWSYSDTKSHATSTEDTKPSNALDKCGEWTFIPYYVTSCGSISAGSIDMGDTSLDPNEGHICKDVKTTGNFCQTTPYTNSDGSAAGKTVFVAKDCDNDWPEPFCFQQSEYLIKGVAANESVYNDQVKAHEDFDPSKPIESTPQGWCEKDLWPLQPGSLPGTS